LFVATLVGTGFLVTGGLVVLVGFGVDVALAVFVGLTVFVGRGRTAVVVGFFVGVLTGVFPLAGCFFAVIVIYKKGAVPSINRKIITTAHLSILILRLIAIAAQYLSVQHVKPQLEHFTHDFCPQSPHLMTSVSAEPHFSQCII